MFRDMPWLLQDPWEPGLINCVELLESFVHIGLHDGFGVCLLLLFFSQNAKLRTVSPVSVETFAQNVRKVCICTKGDVT